MKKNINRRDFIKKSTIIATGISLEDKLHPSIIKYPIINNEHYYEREVFLAKAPDIPFAPRRAASWWTTIEDLLWSQKMIKDKVKRRAEDFAKANIDTAINFGFHARFDFSNYFGQMNEYFAFVKEELHKHNIKYLDHYSCNNVERPKNKEEFEKLHRRQRHHVLLFHDPIAAKHAQYEGHRFQDICEVDLFNGERGYALQYQFEAFCHNNPGFLDMHRKYLERLIKEVDFDGYQIDDMCDYVGLRACGCKFCKERFKKDYGQEIPPASDKSFWGDMSKPMLYWGDYESPIFRNWIKMKDDVVADHVAMVKQIVGSKPLFTCCSSTGPIVLNSISLNLERIADIVDFYMLENVGISIHSVNWTKMDVEALQQKDIAKKRGNSPAIALSYTIYRDGGYLGWSLARFWGVANWASTIKDRVYEEDPIDAIETAEMIQPCNNWEVKHSDLNHYDSEEFVEVRLAYNYYCRINGWRDSEGLEHWDKTKIWSKNFVENNIGYRIVRYKELEDANQLLLDKTPLLLDGVGCVSDAQFNAIQNYLSKGGIMWVSFPFGTHDEKGFKRKTPLSEQLLKKRYKNLLIIDSITKNKESFSTLIKNGNLIPTIQQTAGEEGWKVRFRKYGNKPVIHFMNSKLKAIPHPTAKDIGQAPVLNNIESLIQNNLIEFEIDARKINFSDLKLYSPELDDKNREIIISRSNDKLKMKVDLNGIKVYALGQ